MLKYLILVITTLFFTACSYKNKPIEDTQKYSQNPSSYTKNLNIAYFDQKSLAKEFKKNYFQVWDLEKISYSKEEASWANSYLTKELYLENRLKASKHWFEKHIENSNFENYNQLLQKAILIKNSDLKVFPTKNKIFSNPNKAGEGYPFDYNQNSRLKINTPILISHYSKDKAWAFVQSGFILGWIRTDNLLIIDKKDEDEFRNNQLYVVVKEGFEIFDKNLLEDLKVGTFFPKKDDKFLLATNNGLKKISINSYKIKKFPINFDSKNIENLSKEFIGELYGWGGINNNRDCSSFTKDFFAPFGIYLKRNSKSQTQLHKYIDISKLSAKEKKRYILENSNAFLTLIYLKGHIMLYVGEKDKEPLVMHNFWGVRTFDILGRSSRNIVGKTVITTLEPGIELFNADKSKTILERVKGLVLLNKKKI